MGMSRIEVGDLGERLVCRLLSSQGFSVRRLKPGQGPDVIATDKSGAVVKIEVKAACKGRDNKWRATLVKEGHTNHNKSDIVMLICLSSSGVTIFVIPVRDIQNRRHIAITSDPATYRGMFAKYRQDKLSL